MGRLPAMIAVASFAWACVAEFPVTEPTEPTSRKPADHGMDLGQIDLGSVGDQDVIDQGQPEPEPQPAPQPDPDPDPDMLPVDEGVVDAAPPPPPVPDMAPPLAPFIRFDAVASGRNFACGRRAADQQVLCWGENNHGQLDVPARALTPFGLGYDHGCGYDADALVIRCWGRNDRGQATRATAALDVRGFVGGDRVTCGLTDLGFGCLGEFALFKVEADLLRSIAVGEDHICAFRSRGDRPTCWGDASGGRHAVPDGFLLHPGSLAASKDQICGRVLGTDTIACWGPGDPPPQGIYRQIFPSAGDHLCAINVAGVTVCWGQDNRGQATPPPGVRFTQLAGGAEHTCGLDTDGRIHCWGRGDNHGQLDVPTP